MKKKENKLKEPLLAKNKRKSSGENGSSVGFTRISNFCGPSLSSQPGEWLASVKGRRGRRGRLPPCEMLLFETDYRCALVGQAQAVTLQCKRVWLHFITVLFFLLKRLGILSAEPREFKSSFCEMSLLLPYFPVLLPFSLCA